MLPPAKRQEHEKWICWRSTDSSGQATHRSVSCKLRLPRPQIRKLQAAKSLDHRSGEHARLHVYAQQRANHASSDQLLGAVGERVTRE